MDRLERIRDLVSGLSRHDDPRVSSAVTAVLDELNEPQDPREQSRLNPQGLISISQAMQLSRKSRNTIKNWVSRGLLTEYRSKTNHELFVRKAELEDLLKLTEVHTETHVPAGWKLHPYEATKPAPAAPLEEDK
jgi:hypothetical protein